MRLALGLAFYMVVLIGAFAVHSAAGFGAVLVAMPLLAFVLPQLVRRLDARHALAPTDMAEESAACQWET